MFKGAFIVSGAPGQARLAQGFALPQQIQQQVGDEVENSLLAGGVTGPDGYPTPSYLDLATTPGHPAAHFTRQGSPGGHDSDGEQDQ